MASISEQITITPAFAVVQALAALPTSLPVLEALTGALPSIREDQAAHYVTSEMLVRFLSGYGTLDAAETASTEEGEAYRMACGLLAQINVSEAVRFDPDLLASIHEHAVRPVA